MKLNMSQLKMLDILKKYGNVAINRNKVNTFGKDEIINAVESLVHKPVVMKSFTYVDGNHVVYNDYIIELAANISKRGELVWLNLLN